MFIKEPVGGPAAQSGHTAPPSPPSPATDRGRRSWSSTAAARLRALGLWVVLAAIGAYRLLIAPLLAATLGPVCRFDPSCSEYARQAFIEHGLARGFYLTIRRLSRCHPLGGWGYDPVPADRRARPAPSLKEKFG